MMLDGLGPIRDPAHEFDRRLEPTEREGPLKGFTASGPFDEFHQRLSEGGFGDLFDRVWLLSHDETLYRDWRFARSK